LTDLAETDHRANIRHIDSGGLAFPLPEFLILVVEIARKTYIDQEKSENRKKGSDLINCENCYFLNNQKRRYAKP
jgi:hypothetical protein